VGYSVGVEREHARNEPPFGEEPIGMVNPRWGDHRMSRAGELHDGGKEGVIAVIAGRRRLRDHHLSSLIDVGGVEDLNETEGHPPGLALLRFSEGRGDLEGDIPDRWATKGHRQIVQAKL